MTEWALPGLLCPCCGTVTFAEPPPGAHRGSVSYGPALNAAAVLLSCCGNVPPERAAQVIGMLLGIEVSAGWVDKAGTEKMASMRRRVAAGLTTTFASQYTDEVSLAGALQLDAIAAYGRQATGKKYLINPNG